MNAQTQGWEKMEVLVNRTGDGRLETDQFTLDRLSSINSPVHVVAAAGPYRTGKSHLLNVIIEALFGKTNLFPVGDTVQAQTKGISVWCHPHPSVKGHWIIFLDTEGLNDVEKGDRDNDILLFVLTILLSSTLVYNSCGVIDYRALETIHHVSVLAEKIRMMPDLGEDLEDFGFDLAFPELLWVVRDFQLNLEMNGTQITDDEYLENALSTSNMVLGPKKATVISVKRCIKEYFARRKCFLLPNLLRSANSSTTTAVTHQRDCTSHLIDQVAIGECKMHQGSEVTGRVLGKLAEELVEECQQRFHSQQPINVQEVMERIAERENNAAVAKSLDLYRTEINERTEEAVEEVTLHQIHFNCSERATTNFMHVAVYPVDGGFIKLMDAIRLEFDQISQKNAAKIKELCDQTFMSLRKEIIGVNNTKYLCSGGFQKYREDMTELRKRWEQNPVLQGVGGRDFFNKMMSTLRENEAKLIMDADRSMTELRKQDALKQQQEERKRHEALKKQKDKSSETAVEHDRSAFEQRVTSQVRSAILRPHEAEISKLTCRIEVLDRELNGLRARHSEDEVETYEQRIRNYQRMLSEKQNQPSKWQKVSSSIQSFARGTYDSIRRLFKLSNAADVKPCCGEAPDMRSSPSMALPVPSRASSCGPSSQSAAVSRAGPSGCSSARPAASMSAAASSGSSLGPRVSYSKASSGSSSAPPVSSSSAPPVSSSSTPPVSSSGSSSASSSVSSSAPSSGSSSAVSSGSSSAVSSGSSSASSGSASAPPVSSTAAAAAAAAASISSSTPPAASSAPPSDSSLAPTASSAAAAAASVSASASP